MALLSTVFDIYLKGAANLHLTLSFRLLYALIL